MDLLSEISEILKEYGGMDSVRLKFYIDEFIRVPYTPDEAIGLITGVDMVDTEVIKVRDRVIKYLNKLKRELK